jgi:CSLREA domain-containing protein
MIAGRRIMRPSLCRCLFLGLLVAAAVAAKAGQASAAEVAYVRTGQSSLTAFDTTDFLPVSAVQLAGSSLWGMTTFPATQRLYAFDINTQTVLVIDAARSAVIGSIPLQNLHFTPHGMATSADGKRLYFAAVNRPLGLIGLDLERGLLMGEFAVPYAWRVVPHPTLDRLWVTTMYGELYTLRASDMAILGHRPFAGEEIALSDDGSKLYVSGGGSLQVIDAATDEILKYITTGFGATALRVSGRWAYLSNLNQPVLEVIDLVEGRVEAEITLDVGRYVHVGGIDVTADGSRVIVLLDNDLRYKFAVVDGKSHVLLSLHDGVVGDLICSSKFIMDVKIPEVTFAVNSTADAVDASPGDGVCETGAGNGVCTLRAAVQEANAAPGAAVVQLPAGEYLLSIPGMDEDRGATGDLDVLGRLTIRGAGSETTVIDAGALDRVLEVGAGASLHLEGVTVRNGRLPSRDPALSTNRAGAGILNGGLLSLTGVAVLDNRTEGFGGAGVHSDGVLRAENCTFSGNVSQGVVFFRDMFGNLVSQLSEGYAAIYAQHAEVTGCLVTGNTGAVAVWTDGALSGSAVIDNDARGVRARSVSTSTIRGNRGPGCSAALIVDSTVSGNVNAEPNGCGGGVFWDDPYRMLVVTRSTISGNAATYGGGVCAKYFEMGNSTVSGNAATGDGGGIYVMAYDEWSYIRNCTITGNTADSDGDGFGNGGGIFNQHQDTSYDTSLYNTILAGNFDLGGEAPDCSGYLGSGQFNLVGDMGGCGFAALAWDITGSAGAPVDPGLGPLADNGGPTMTHALLAGSPAIDAGHPYVFPPTDQRGVTRPQDGTYDGTAYSDIGAFELSVSFQTITASAGAGGSITPAGSVNVPRGGSRGFAIAAAANYHVADVLVDGVSVGPVSTWSFDDVVADHAIDASFAIDTSTITASAGTGGSIAPAGAMSLPHGGSATFDITPAAHHHVADVLVDGVSVGPVGTWSFDGVAADHTIAASFAIDTYAVTASAGPKGSITPAGTTLVPYGGSLIVRVKPRAGFQVARLIVDGRNLGPRTRFVIRGCSANHVIQARFLRLR